MNTGFGRNTPALRSVCPCALLIVKTKARRTGNCRRLKLTQCILSLGVIFTRGISIILPRCCPVIISAVISNVLRFRTISRVPLHAPALLFRLRKSMMGTPILSSNLCGAIPDGVMELSTSTFPANAQPSSSDASSALRNGAWSSPGHICSTLVLSISTSSTLGVRIARDDRYCVSFALSARSGKTSLMNAS